MATVPTYTITTGAPISMARAALRDSWVSNKRLVKYPIQEAGSTYYFKFQPFGGGIDYAVDVRENSGTVVVSAHVRSAMTSQTKMWGFIPMGKRRVNALWAYTKVIDGMIERLRASGHPVSMAKGESRIG